MFHIILYQPEIPPNTGNIIRLCANTGASLHVIHPLGFTLDHRNLRRAGLDYHDLAVLTEHESLSDCLTQLKHPTTWACTTRAKRCYTTANFAKGDALLFGPETRGLPTAFLERHSQEQALRIPMMPDNRSLNLANAVSVIIFEAWRQQDFSGAA